MKMIHIANTKKSFKLICILKTSCVIELRGFNTNNLVGLLQHNNVLYDIFSDSLKTTP